MRVYRILRLIWLSGISPLLCEGLRTSRRSDFWRMLARHFLVGDENPLREPERWRRNLASRIRIPFWTVDADVVVPSKLIEKAQYGAYTIRPRIQRLLPEFLCPYEN